MKSKNDTLFQAVVYVLTALICLITLYPLIYVLSASFSDPARILGGDVVLWPVDVTTNAYRRVFASADILTGYRNTLLYTLFGTSLNMVATIMAAYPLSLPDLKGKNIFTFFITFTMFFGAGMIPSYLNLKDLGLLNNPLVVIVPGAISVTNMLIMRNYFINSVPAALREAASIDGATGMQALFKVKLPMVMPSITICSFLTLTNSFKLFDQNLSLTGGEPAKASQMLALNIYDTFYQRSGAQWKGIGQAKAVVFFLLVIVIALIQLYFTRRKEVQQ